MNQQLGQKLVPTIKLAKAIVSSLPEQQRLTGYHTEALAIKVFRDYRGPLRTREMVRHFFERAADAVMQSMRETTGQSLYVDDYLGGERSAQRQTVAAALERIARRMRNADSGHVTEGWHELLG